MSDVNFSAMNKYPSLFTFLLIGLAFIGKLQAQAHTPLMKALQIDLGTPYQWAQSESHLYGKKPLRFSAEFLYFLSTNHRWGLTLDADYSNYRFGYALFIHQGQNYHTIVRLQHVGLYAGLRAYLLRFPWQFDNGLFVEPQLGLAYESGKDNTPNVQLLPRPQFMRLDWRLRAGMLFPLSRRFQLSPSVELNHVSGAYLNDIQSMVIAELNIGFKF